MTSADRLALHGLARRVAPWRSASWPAEAEAVAMKSVATRDASDAARSLALCAEALVLMRRGRTRRGRRGPRGSGRGTS